MTRQFKKLAHSLYECKYHLVFCPKYRYKILQPEVAAYVHQAIYQLCQQKEGMEVLELNVQVDHIHLVLSIPPKYAVSQVVGYLKGKVALRTFDRFRSCGNGIGGSISGHAAIVSARLASTKNASGSMCNGNRRKIKMQTPVKVVCSTN